MLRKADPPDDDPGPALQTPRRVATQLEGVYLEVSRAAGRLQGIGCCLDSRQVEELAEQLGDLVARLAQLRGRVLIGDVPIVAGLDDSGWRDRQPLIAMIEQRGGGDQSQPPAKSPTRPVGRSRAKRPAVTTGSTSNAS